MRLAGGQRGGNVALSDLPSPGDREDAGNLLTPQISVRSHLGSSKLEPSYSKVADHLGESDQRIASINMLNRRMDGIRTKVLPASGFSQFLVKTSLRGKGFAYRHQEVQKGPRGVTQNRNNAVRHNNDSAVDAHLSDKPSVKVDDRVLVGGGNEALATQHVEISLRECLMPRHHKLDKLQRLHMFKQILKFVDTSHSQGLVLQHLWPSYFLISPSNQVRYVGSFVTRSQIEQVEGSFNQDLDNCLEPHLKRKKYWHDHSTSSPKHQKPGELYKTPMMPGRILSTSTGQHSSPVLLKLEEKWYASPEELNNSARSFSSNIYSLGVLFFEVPSREF